MNIPADIADLAHRSAHVEPGNPQDGSGHTSCCRNHDLPVALVLDLIQGVLVWTSTSPGRQLIEGYPLQFGLHMARVTRYPDLDYLVNIAFVHISSW